MAHFEELRALNANGKSIAPRIEMPTPHRVTILILMKQYLSEKRMQAESGLSYPPNARRNFCMLLLKLIQYPDLSYNELHNMLTSTNYKIETLHLQSFEKAMSDMFSVGIEALFDFGELQNIENMLCEEWGVSQFSIMGVYIRRVGVVLERLSFPEMMALYKNICLYYERGVRALAIGPRKMVVSGGVLYGTEQDSESSSATTTAAEVKEDDSTTTAAVITQDTAAEPLCTYGGGLLGDDTIILDRNPLSKWSPKQAKLFVHQQSELLERNELRALPPYDLQKRLNEIIQDNPLICSAHFLSYMNQLRVRDYFNAINALHRAFDRCSVRIMSQEKGFQYFCINLAVLHATFGHKREALAALKEGIMLAQENGDKCGLTLSNMWYTLLRVHDPHMRNKCIVETDIDMPILHSTWLALQYAVKISASNGKQPLCIFEILQYNDELRTRYNLLEHMSDSLALRSAVWSVYGRHELSSLYAQILLNMRKSLTCGDVSNTESVASVLSSFSLWLFLQGEKNLSSVLLQHARECFVRYPNSESWLISQLHIIIQDGIYRCRWHDSLKACDQLYMHDKTSGLLQRATVLLAKRYFYGARRLLQRLQLYKNLTLLMRIRIIILLAYCSMADKTYSSETVVLLLDGAEQTSAAKMEYEHALIHMMLAQVLLMLGLSQKAYQTIKDSMDVIHINGCLYDRAKTDFVFVRCLMATVGKDMPAQKVHLMQSVTLLERAAQSFKKLEAHAKVLDVYVYMAQCFNALGDRQLRNKYAAEFRRYHTEHPIMREYLGMAF